MAENKKGAQKIMKFELDKSKVYAIYYGSDGFIVGQYLESVECGEGFLLVMRKLEEGWAHHKRHFINPSYLMKIVEFDSFEEYKQHYTDWEEEEKVRKFKND